MERSEFKRILGKVLGANKQFDETYWRAWDSYRRQYKKPLPITEGTLLSLFSDFLRFLKLQKHITAIQYISWKVLLSVQKAKIHAIIKEVKEHTHQYQSCQLVSTVQTSSQR